VQGSANGVVCTGQAAGQPPPGGSQSVPGPGRGEVITSGEISALQTTFVSAAMNTFLQTMLLVLGLMALLSPGLGWLVAGRVLRPLQQITATAKRLSERTLYQRIALEGPDDELKELADTFDRMLSRLDAAFDSQRRFTANASHELRTPLAISRTEVDLALSDPDASTAELRVMAERVRDATDRSERLIEHTGRAHGAAGLHVAAELRPAPVEGDPALLDRMVANLVENAVRHNQPSGWLEVTVRVPARGPRPRLSAGAA
jgi:signal transduction histidine kinase